MSEEQAFKAEEARKLKGQLSTPAILLIGAGVILLLANMAGIRLIEYLWPGFVIGPALLLLWPAYASTAEKVSVQLVVREECQSSIWGITKI